MPKMPNTIRVGYKDVGVLKTLMDDEHSGLFRHGVESLILLDKEQEGVELVDTVVHETLHAIWRYYGLTETAYTATWRSRW